MASPFYRVIKGNFVIVGKEPDGDSVRFIAENPDFYEDLHRNYRIKLSHDGSVQLRFEGVDAPEVHYGKAAQPLGTQVRDQLLDWMSFRNIQFAGNRVQSADPDTVSGAILSQAADANGRPVSYVLLEQANQLGDKDWIRVDTALLKKTLNFQLISEGLAYYTVYTSTPSSHRRLLRKAASAAREENLGVWKEDATSEFVLENSNSIGSSGQLILPKLFRRCTDYLKAVNDGFRGNLKDWIIAISEGSRSENDRVLIGDSIEVQLSDLIEQRNSRVIFKGDLLSLTFMEK